MFPCQHGIGAAAYSVRIKVIEDLGRGGRRERGGMRMDINMEEWAS